MCFYLSIYRFVCESYLHSYSSFPHFTRTCQLFFVLSLFSFIYLFHLDLEFVGNTNAKCQRMVFLYPLPPHFISLPWQAHLPVHFALFSIIFYSAFQPFKAKSIEFCRPCSFLNYFQTLFNKPEITDYTFRKFDRN